jgi:hypothetical protein
MRRKSEFGLATAEMAAWLSGARSLSREEVHPAAMGAVVEM